MQDMAECVQVSSEVVLSGTTRICTLFPQHFADINLY
jgi:hypothetical protein